LVASRLWGLFAAALGLLLVCTAQGQVSGIGPAEDAPGASPTPAAAAADGQQAGSVLLIQTSTLGVDPVVGEYVTTRLADTLGSMGYGRVSAERSWRAARRVGMPYPPAAADLWRAAWAAGAAHGVAAEVSARGGQYVLAITVACVDGRGPFVRSVFAGSEDLLDGASRLLSELLPLPGTAPVGGYQAAGGGARQPRYPVPGAANPSAREVWIAREGWSVSPSLPRWNLAASAESALGLAEPAFLNHMTGLRLDLRVDREIFLAAGVHYANLAGREQRVHNVMPLLQIENRLSVGRTGALRIPLRAGLGYLPKNGPALRLSAGLAWRLGPRWQIGADLLSPMLWVLPGSRVALSMNLGLDLVYAP